VCVCVCVCAFVCVFVSICLFVRPFVCLSFGLPSCLSVYLSVCVCVLCLCLCACICVYDCEGVQLSSCMSQVACVPSWLLSLTLNSEGQICGRITEEDKRAGEIEGGHRRT